MNPHKFIRDEILKALDGLVAEGRLAGGLDTTRVNVEPPREAQHGDLATNAAMVLAKAGHKVTREYYINDAGAQVDVLARSTYLRYREALGEDIGIIPEGLYPGDYLKDAGAALAKRDGRKWFDKPESEWLAPIRAF